MGTVELPVRIAVNTGIQFASYPEEMSRPPGRTVMPSPHVGNNGPILYNKANMFAYPYLLAEMVHFKVTNKLEFMAIV